MDSTLLPISAFVGAVYVLQTNQWVQLYFVPIEWVMANNTGQGIASAPLNVFIHC